MSDIHFILTGGTIDSYYYPPKETSVPHDASVIPEYIQKIQPHISCSFEEICMLDSGEITNEIRGGIVTAIEDSNADKIIITHGTNTMSETARYLETHLRNNNKAIILTGAMIPLKEFAMSDAGFNLGYAMAKAQDTANGVYIAMNAKLFPAGEVVKNTEIGRFERG